jgi:hypothetical protein
VLGRWQSVDFVEKIEQFEVGKKLWPESGLFLKELVFLPDGKMSVSWYTWTKGLVLHSGNKTASRYVIKELQGSSYMFFEWKSGDYTIRGTKPQYYVLKKEPAAEVPNTTDAGRGPVYVPVRIEIKYFDRAVPLGVKTFDKPLLIINSVKFHKDRGRIDAALKIRVTSYPKKSWKISFRLVDKDGHKIDSAVKEIENSGTIRKVPQVTEETLKISFDRADSSSVKWFDIKIGEFEDISAGTTAGQEGNRTPPQRAAGQAVEQVSSRAGEKEKLQNVDLYIEDFKIKPYETGGLYTVTAKIGNRGTATAPAFRMNFFRGDPKDNLNLHGKAQTGSHGAGPIKPGEFWNESSRPFSLKEGINQLAVVLDTDNSIAETNALNNSAEIKVLFENGKIIEKPVEQNKIDNETNNVSQNSMAEKKVNAARALKINIYEGNSVNPQTSVRMPLVAMKIVRQLLPPKDKLQIIAQKIKLDEGLPKDMNSQELIEMLDGMLKKLDQGVESTTLLEVKDGNERIIIAIE